LSLQNFWTSSDLSLIIFAMRDFLPVIALLAVATVWPAQNGNLLQTTGKGPTLAGGSLAKPVDCGFFTARMFSDSEKVSFALTTSWIPGEKHKGMLRYRLGVFPAHPDPPTKEGGDAAIAESVEKLMNRVSRCSISANLYDADGFILRKVAVSLHLGFDDQARLHSLSANDSVQMDAQEYRSFIGTSEGRKGSWGVEWTCGSAPGQ
jgi:hypothetical protein